jgi:hypothetical protein
MWTLAISARLVYLKIFVRLGNMGFLIRVFDYCQSCASIPGFFSILFFYNGIFRFIFFFHICWWYVPSFSATSAIGKTDLKACTANISIFHLLTANDYEATESPSAEDPEDPDYAPRSSSSEQVWNPWSIAGVMLRFSFFLPFHTRTIIYFYFKHESSSRMTHVYIWLLFLLSFSRVSFPHFILLFDRQTVDLYIYLAHDSSSWMTHVLHMLSFTRLNLTVDSCYL